MNKLPIKYKISIVLIIIIVFIIILLFNNSKNDNVVKLNDTKIINNYTSLKTKLEEINEENWILNEVNMDWWLEETLKYWHKWAKLIWYFDWYNYNLSYLFSCDKFNKFTYKCPKAWFTDFEKQFNNTGSINIIKWEYSYFIKNNEQLSIFAEENNYIFILKDND